jgi:hypothetical protein
MKLYALYTPSHEDLKEQWFLRSLQDDYELVLVKEEQHGPLDSHRYGTEQFNRTTRRKVGLIIKAIQENWDGFFVFSDVDIQFFRPTLGRLKRLIAGRDIAFQQNDVSGEINTGFFICRGNRRTRNLWTAVRDGMQARPDLNDQDVLNRLMFQRLSGWLQRRVFGPGMRRVLQRLAMVGIGAHRLPYLLTLCGNDFDVKWRYLPIEFYTVGVRDGSPWNPGKPMRLPNEIILHHANFCVGVENKVKQLLEVRAAVTGESAPAGDAQTRTA